MLYVGVRGRIDLELVGREGIPFEAVTAGPLRVGSALGAARGALALGLGGSEAYGILKRFRPDVVFATGGYGSVGVGLAARLLRRPLLLFLPDVEAGLAVKALTRVATSIAVTNAAALKAMPRAKAVVSGYPVRRAFFEAERETGRARLGLHPSLPTLLVSGASTGASRINRAVIAWAPDFLRLGQLVHLCGRNDEAWLSAEREKMPLEMRERYYLFGYLHDDIALALAAADVGVMRSGASTLGELPATRLPAILVPGEYEGWDQSPNARYLAEKGAAVMLSQDRLDVELRGTVMALLGDGARRQKMKEALAALARPEAADRLAQMVIDMAGVLPGVAA